jgi:hypothetical protein
MARNPLIELSRLEALLVKGLRPVLAGALVRVDDFGDRRVLGMYSMRSTWFLTGVDIVIPAGVATTGFYAHCVVIPLFLPEPTPFSSMLRGSGRLPWSSAEWRLEDGREVLVLEQLRSVIERRRRNCLEKPATLDGFIGFVDSAIQDQAIDPEEVREALAYAYLLLDQSGDCLRLLESLYDEVPAERQASARQERARMMVGAVRSGSDAPRRQLWTWRDTNLSVLRASAVDV